EFVASAVRALGAAVDAQAAFGLARASAEIGEPLYQAQPPTGYPDRAEAWVTSGALLARMNFALALASGRYPRVTVDPGALVAGADPRSPDAVLDRLLAVLVAGQTSAEPRAVPAAQLTNPDITRLRPDDRGPATTDGAQPTQTRRGRPGARSRRLLRDAPCAGAARAALGESLARGRPRLRLARHDPLALRRPGLHGVGDARSEGHARRLARARREDAPREAGAVPRRRAGPRPPPRAPGRRRSDRDAVDRPVRHASSGHHRARRLRGALR